MLGIHDHSKNKHTLTEVAATFLIILVTALSANYGLTDTLPSLDVFYGNLLSAISATGLFYGVNAFNASRKTQAAKKVAVDECNYLIDGVEL